MMVTPVSLNGERLNPLSGLHRTVAQSAHGLSVGTFRHKQACTGKRYAVRTMCMAKTTSEFMSIKEAAAIIGVYPHTLWRWIRGRHRNCPPHLRVGRRLIRIPRDQFKEWLKEK
jgi:excisionase family DNA binding protein